MSINSYRSSVARFTQEKANLENNLARERNKLSQLYRDISSLNRSLISTKSPSTRQFKQRQVDAKQKDLAQCLKNIADLEIKISAKLADMNRNLQSLEKEEPKKRGGLGIWKGKIWMSDDFDAPLEEFEEYM